MSGHHIAIEDCIGSVPTEQEWRDALGNVGEWMRCKRGRMAQFALLLGVHRQRVSKWFHPQKTYRQKLEPRAAAAVWCLWMELRPPIRGQERRMP